MLAASSEERRQNEEKDKAMHGHDTTNYTWTLVFLVTVGIMDELPMNLLRRFRIKQLPALVALEFTLHSNPDVRYRTVAGHRRFAQLHRRVTDLEVHAPPGCVQDSTEIPNWLGVMRLLVVLIVNGLAHHREALGSIFRHCGGEAPLHP